MKMSFNTTHPTIFTSHLSPTTLPIHLCLPSPIQTFPFVKMGEEHRFDKIWCNTPNLINNMAFTYKLLFPFVPFVWCELNFPKF